MLKVTWDDFKPAIVMISWELFSCLAGNWQNSVLVRPQLSREGIPDYLAIFTTPGH
jgi:hypothetical protein